MSPNFPAARISRVLGLVAVGAGLASAGFSAHFDPASPYLASAEKDTLRLHGDVTASEGIVDLGANGLLSLSKFKQPEGPFSVELRIKLKDYGPLSTRYISDFVNTATWGGTTPQGFTVRVGGGELYPVLSQEAYTDANGFRPGEYYFDATTRAQVSQCVGEFAIGTGGAYWKEVYTDRCLELNKWLHIVATYDGEEMRYFVDGHDATDGWRVQGVDAVPVMDPFATLYLGARSTESWDSRHSSAQLDFVNVLDSALTPAMVRARYRATLLSGKQDTVVPSCRRTLKVLSPEAGKAVTPGTEIRVRLEASPECEDSTIEFGFKQNEFVEFQASTSPEFSEAVTGCFRDTSSTLGKALGTLPQGKIFVRARLRNDSDTAAKAAPRMAARATAVSSPLVPWEASKPLMVAQTTGIHAKGAKGLSTRWNGAELYVGSLEKPIVTDIGGRLQSWGTVKNGKGWTLKPQNSMHGVYLVGAGSSVATVVVP